MPSFSEALDDTQIKQLLDYMRARFAPGKTAWTGAEDAVCRARTPSAR